MVAVGSALEKVSGRRDTGRIVQRCPLILDACAGARYATGPTAPRPFAHGSSSPSLQPPEIINS